MGTIYILDIIVPTDTKGVSVLFVMFIFVFFVTYFI